MFKLNFPAYGTFEKGQVDRLENNLKQTSYKKSLSKQSYKFKWVCKQTIIFTQDPTKQVDQHPTESIIKKGKGIRT